VRFGSSRAPSRVTMSCGPQYCDSAISTLVPAVFLVFRKMNR
jgi:hypothetical protein